MLLRVRDDVQKTFAAYQKLFESGYAFGMRKALQAEVDKKDRSKTVRTFRSFAVYFHMLILPT